MDALRTLRGRIARIERSSVDACLYASTGVDSLDRSLGGGLAQGRLHEIFAAAPDDIASAAGFMAMLAQIVGPCGASLAPPPLVWLRAEESERRGGRLHAPGLAAIGLDPARLVLVVLPDPVALLRAAADVVRCPQVGAVVIELRGHPRALDLTATRRLAVAAETSGVTPLMLRVEAEPTPNAAQTRWSVAAAPCAPLEADAPGFPAFDVALLRQRGRPAGEHWRLEWDGDRSCFREAPSGAVVPAAEHGSLAAARG